MDAKEAIENLKNYPMYNYYFPDTKISQATRLAISALEKVETLEAENVRLREKETPKAIKQRAYNFRGEEVGVCPNNHRVQVYDNYCHICGQKLDWASDKE